jgi:broad specificity phosphatase PhoE
MITTGPAALDLVRHAESEGNVADLAARRAGAQVLDVRVRDADVELSAAGLRQAHALGGWLAGRPAGERPEIVLSSPYRRAVATARAAVEGAGLDVDIRLDERLRERELGVFDGLTGTGVRARYPEEVRRRAWLGKFYYRPPGGESWCDVVLRLRGLFGDLAAEADGRRVLVVSHQAVIMNARYVLERLTEAEVLELDAGPPIANCALTRYVRAATGTLRLEAFNDVRTVASLGAPVTEEPPREEVEVDAEAH